MIEKLRRLAHKSDHGQFKHGAVVLKGGAIQAFGYNLAQTHAEVHALKKLWPSKRRGTTVFNLRFSRTGIANSRPCDRCMGFMEAFGVKNIWFYENGKLVKERV